MADMYLYDTFILAYSLEHEMFLIFYLTHLKADVIKIKVYRQDTKQPSNWEYKTITIKVMAAPSELMLS